MNAATRYSMCQCASCNMRRQRAEHEREEATEGIRRLLSDPVVIAQIRARIAELCT
jgi:hypothetical protein